MPENRHDEDSIALDDNGSNETAQAALSIISQDDLLLEGGNEGIEPSSSWLYLLALTCTVGGLQVVWSVILSNGTPVLVALGLSKSLTALVWAAGPLCGMIVQPIIGVLNDASACPFGRRRPLILLGTLGVITSMLTLSWIEDFADLLATVLELHDRNLNLQPFVIAIAILMVYVLNICIQPVQMSMRALIVEQAPPSQQHRASAWASYMTGAGNIFGYVFGYLEVERVIKKPALTHFQSLCVIASIALSCTALTACIFVHEKTPRSNRKSRKTNFRKVLEIPRMLLACYQDMPQTIRKVFHIQFWAWMGWFPFLYYSTTYVKELYVSSELLLQAPQRTINARSLRAGTLANLSFAAVALLANILLSIFFTQTTPSKSPLAFRIQDRNLNLPIIFLWALAHIFFSFVMLFTFFITSYIGGTILVVSLGFSWSLTLWAPFAIIGHEIENEMREEGKKFGVTQTGTIVGLNNVAISAPQIIAAGICSAVFAAADALGSQDGTAWVLRFGACAMLGSGWLTWRLSRCNGQGNPRKKNLY